MRSRSSCSHAVRAAAVRGAGLVGGRGKPALTRRDWMAILGSASRLLPGELSRFRRACLRDGQLRAPGALPQPDPRAGALAGCCSGGARARQLVAMAVSYSGVLLVFGHELQFARADVALGAALVFSSALSYARSTSSAAARRSSASARCGSPAWPPAWPACCASCSSSCCGRSRRRRRWRPGDLAVGAERHAVHLRAGADGDDGDRAHRLHAGRADRHAGPDVDHPMGVLLLGEPFTVGGSRHGAGAGRRVAAGALAIDKGEHHMDLGIAGRWALVCAASKGLGRGCAMALAGEGVNVVITARVPRRWRPRPRRSAPRIRACKCAACRATSPRRRARRGAGGLPAGRHPRQQRRRPAAG